VRELGVPVPFILVSGEIGEDVAVQAMRDGAGDYLLKNNLARLAPALLHAIDARGPEGPGRGRPAGRVPPAGLGAGRHLQTSVELERAAIAREIHDDVGGSLSAVKFDLAWMDRQPGISPEVRQRIDSALETVTHASTPASASCTTCARPSWSRAWWPRCSG
jgi:signal transduction histidine kinase